MSVVEAIVPTTLKWHSAATFLHAQRDWWAWWLIWWGICVLAYLTNPAPSSFRTHLTSLSFHTHLRRLSIPSSSRPSSLTAVEEGSASPDRKSDLKSHASQGQENGLGFGHGVRGASKDGSGSTSGKTGHAQVGETTKNRVGGSGSPTAATHIKSKAHVLSFSNRISLSVRTPPYITRSYYFFSIVVMGSPSDLTKCSNSSAPSSPSNSTSDSPRQTQPLFRSIGDEKEKDFGIFIGAFGRWYEWSLGASVGVGEEEREELKRERRLLKGVVEMKVGDAEQKDLDEYSSCPASANTATSNNSTDLDPPVSPATRSPTSRTSRPTKRVFRGGQRRPSPTSFARLRSKAESSSNVATPPNGTHSSEGANENGHTKHESSEGEGFYSTPSTVPSGHDAGGAGDDDLDATSIIAFSGPLDPVIEELKTQLEEVQVHAEESEQRLQGELEVLRGKKKEEDNFRAELKAKTKGLEEQKRLAELGRVEAERELGERKGEMKRAAERVEKLRQEIGALDRKELEVVERKEKKKRERKEREKKLMDDVGKKKDKLKATQGGVEKLVAKVVAMEKTIDARREMLQSRRNDLAARNLSGFVPFGGVGGVMGNMYRKGGGYGYANSLGNGSRPGSVRSGHLDHYATSTGPYDTHRSSTSPPASPTLTQPLSPAEDGSSFSDPSYYGTHAFATRHAAANVGAQGFLKHRLAHRRHEFGLHPEGTSRVSMTGMLPSVDDISSSFHPFDLDDPRDLSPTTGGDRHSPPRTGRPQLSLPLQYLESGLLPGQTSPGMDGPLSPMTPHQTSLIPSQLFHMLDEDDEDDFVMPDSPSLGAGDRSSWHGLGLDSLGPMALDAAAEGADVLPRSRENSLSPKQPLSPTSDSSQHVAALSDPVAHPISTAPWDVVDTRFPALDDDLPRHGLSLNPGAKAFAFQPRTHSSPSVASTFNSVIGPPAKSRMDFSSSHTPASQSATAPANAKVLGSQTGTIGKLFEWSREHRSPGMAPRTTSGTFNPFDDEDELLGPLKK